MIGVEESKAIFSLLSAETRSVDDIFSEFNSRFPREAHFRISYSIAMLLEDRKMLQIGQRLVAFGILHLTYSSLPPSSNPFITLLINAASDASSEKVEMAFIQQMLGFMTSNSKEVINQTVLDYINGFDSTSCTLLRREELLQQLNIGAQPESYNSFFKAATVKNVIPDPDIPNDCNSSLSEYG